MDAAQLAKRLTRKAIAAYYAACLEALRNPTGDAVGEVVGGVKRLGAVLGHTRRHTTAALADLSEAKLVRMTGNTSARRIFVVALDPFSTQQSAGCEVCGRPVARINGAKHCPTCYQTHGRPDRKWKALAMEVWARCAALGQPDMSIAYKIHTATKHPLWGTSDGSNRNGRRGGGGSTIANGAAVEGVIPWGVHEGLFDPELMDIRRRALRGEDGE